MSRSSMTSEEREFRSRLAQIVHKQPLVRGTLSLRNNTCGKPNCRCARGDKHLALYLSYSKQGRPHQIFVPKHMEQEVRQWVQNYHTVKELLEQVSEISLQKLKSSRS